MDNQADKDNENKEAPKEVERKQSSASSKGSQHTDDSPHETELKEISNKSLEDPEHPLSQLPTFSKQNSI